MENQAWVSEDFYSRATSRSKKTQGAIGKSPKGSFCSKQRSPWACSQCTDWGLLARRDETLSRDPEKQTELGEKQPTTCLSQSLPGPSKPTFNLPRQRDPPTRARGGDQGGHFCCRVRQAETAREGSCFIPLKLQKQAKCNYNHPTWSSARTSGLMVLLLQEVPWDFSNDHKWSGPQFHISFGR